MPLLNQDPPEAPPAAADATQPPLAAAGGSFNNPLLAQIEAKIEVGLTPDNKPNYMKLVVAGMKLVTGGGPQGLVQKLTASQNPLQSAVGGSINLVAYMARASKGKPAPKAMVPAAMTLMLHALDILDRTGKLKVDQDVIAQATHLFTDNIMKAFGISHQQLQQMMVKAHGVTQNPQQLAAVQKHASLFRPPAPPTQ